MIDCMINDKILNPVVTELLTRGIKSNISIVFITQSYFKENMSDYTLPTFALWKFPIKGNFNKLH